MKLLLAIRRRVRLHLIFTFAFAPDCFAERAGLPLVKDAREVVGAAGETTASIVVVPAEVVVALVRE